ncbi:helix-turn-helix domain-containing protein [[Mycobacterium] nativiensis]|uniref:Helix-turn-helix domain-containing protein n=1 Tax=[Mycobacterium] nativiensis TaxID=2855503 RepID=A0ABU5Y2W0_9MYCO|nr:helix-turn-helix domain-containing protein [Mycolicibacter sp. MYC340]MEB3034562.1 helix-turn-helix domain-containing protein [Mycolicibacter sp. MYC340]
MTNQASTAPLTPGQAADRLGDGVQTIRGWMRTEQCPVVAVGRARRIPTAWVAEQAALMAGAL